MLMLKAFLLNADVDAEAFYLMLMLMLKLMAKTKHWEQTRILTTRLSESGKLKNKTKESPIQAQRSNYLFCLALSEWKKYSARARAKET